MNTDMSNKMIKDLKYLWKRLIFRRVYKIETDEKNLESIVFYMDDQFSYPITKEVYEQLSMVQKERNVELRYTFFKGSVNMYPLKVHQKDLCKNGCCDDIKKPLYFDSKTYCELDFLSDEPTFWFRPELKKNTLRKVPPKEGRSVQQIDGKVVKQPGDLICGIPNRFKQQEFRHWFVCSEQFFRCWKIIMHDSRYPCTIISKLNIRENILKGNKLATNSYKKIYNRANTDAKEVESLDENLWSDEMTIEEIEKKVNELKIIGQDRFWRLRTEKASIEFCHIYVALVLFTQHKEMPDTTNIPQIYSQYKKEILFEQPNWDIPITLLSQYIN